MSGWMIFLAIYLFIGLILALLALETHKNKTVAFKMGAFLATISLWAPSIIGAIIVVVASLKRLKKISKS